MFSEFFVSICARDKIGDRFLSKHKSCIWDGKSHTDTSITW